MLKAMATTDMIDQVILSINDRHILPCNSLLVNLISTTVAEYSFLYTAIYSSLAICARKA